MYSDPRGQYFYYGNESPPLPPKPPLLSASMPRYQDTQHHYHPYGYEPKVAFPKPIVPPRPHLPMEPPSPPREVIPPKPVFLEPMRTPVAHPDGLTVHYQEAANEHNRVDLEKEPKIDDDHDVYRRMEHQLKSEPDDTWLSRQMAAGKKFKSAVWKVAIVVVLVIGGGIVYAVLHHSPQKAPKALGWANGAKEVPTFGANSTTSSHKRSLFPLIGGSRNSIRLRGRNAHLVLKIKKGLD